MGHWNWTKVRCQFEQYFSCGIGAASSSLCEYFFHVPAMQQPCVAEKINRSNECTALHKTYQKLTTGETALKAVAMRSHSMCRPCGVISLVFMEFTIDSLISRSSKSVSICENFADRTLLPAPSAFTSTAVRPHRVFLLVDIFLLHRNTKDTKTNRTQKTPKRTNKYVNRMEIIECAAVHVFLL